MPTPTTVRTSVEVRADPAEAFRVFRIEIASWWNLKQTAFDPERALDLRIEPHVGGALVEVYDQTTGDGCEIGRVRVWEPGHRLAFSWRKPDWGTEQTTEVDIRFTPSRNGTLVALEHSGWQNVPSGEGLRAGYQAGWTGLPAAYRKRVDESTSVA